MSIFNRVITDFTDDKPVLKNVTPKKIKRDYPKRLTEGRHEEGSSLALGDYELLRLIILKNRATGSVFIRQQLIYGLLKMSRVKAIRVLRLPTPSIFNHHG